MLDISCAFATSMATPEHVAAAEALGYRRAWLYDSPALYPDVWMMLAECARRTSTIEIGPGVAIPSLRHPMVTAAAVATLVDLAPGRVNLAIGSGFTGRLTMGQKPLPWSYVRQYVQAVIDLLAGKTTSWEGALIRMMHPEGFGAARPIRIPIILGTGGPKGEAVARELADGVFATQPSADFPRCAVLTFGTVLDPDEDPGSERCMAAAAHAGALDVPRALPARRRSNASGRREVACRARGDPRGRAPSCAARRSPHRAERARPSRRDWRDTCVVRARSARAGVARPDRRARSRRRNRSRVSARRSRHPRRARTLHGRGVGMTPAWRSALRLSTIPR